VRCQGYHLLWLARNFGKRTAQKTSSLVFDLTFDAYCDPWIVLSTWDTNSPYSTSSFKQYDVKVNATCKHHQSCYVLLATTRTQQKNGRDDTVAGS
jgi:hypothetical protein